MQMCARCLAGFERQVACALQEGKKELLFVVHGGSIMAILERHAQPARPFYAFMWTMGTGIFWKSRTDSRFMGVSGAKTGRGGNK